MSETKDTSYAEGFKVGYAKAVAAMYEIYEPFLEAIGKDSERLDWLIENASAYWVYTREDIDKKMEESQ